MAVVAVVIVQHMEENKEKTFKVVITNHTALKTF